MASRSREKGNLRENKNKMLEVKKKKKTTVTEIKVIIDNLLD